MAKEFSFLWAAKHFLTTTQHKIFNESIAEPLKIYNETVAEPFAKAYLS
jgi:hypothetical protein